MRLQLYRAAPLPVCGRGGRAPVQEEPVAEARERVSCGIEGCLRGAMILFAILMVLMLFIMFLRFGSPP